MSLQDYESREKTVDGRVSVVIPCYNKERYVEQSIQSALSQDYEDVEVVVVDDGSDDKSRQIIKKYNQRIIFESQKNQGAPTARNRGLSLATGEFVKFLDADDALTKGILKSQVKKTKNKCNEGEIIFGNISTIDPEGNVVRQCLPYERVHKAPNISIIDLLKENIHTSAPLHRKKMLIDIGGFDEDSVKGQEYDLHIKMFLRGTTFIYEKNSCVYKRRFTKDERITSKNILKEKPMYGYVAVMKRMKRVKNAYGEVPKQARKHFAQHLWKKGRRLLRMEYDEEAEDHFEKAKKICSESAVVGSKAYKTLVKLFGEKNAEKVASLRHLKEMVQP